MTTVWLCLSMLYIMGNNTFYHFGGKTINLTEPLTVGNFTIYLVNILTGNDEWAFSQDCPPVMTNHILIQLRGGNLLCKDEDLQTISSWWVEPTHLKNMRKSNWMISPGFVEKIPNMFEVSPPRFWLENLHPRELRLENQPWMKMYLLYFLIKMVIFLLSC